MDFKAFFRLLTHLVWPRNCALCGAPEISLCQDCLDKLPKLTMPFCVACDKPVPCKIHGQRFRADALCSHEGPARSLILQAKYQHNGDLARRLGQALCVLVPQGQKDWTIVIIPPRPELSLVPRGDDHLLWMARGVSDVTGFPIKCILKWNIHGPRQKERKTKQDRKNMSVDSFCCQQACPQKILLLDDVSTTGTTLYRGASALYKAGAIQVRSLCWSRAL